MNVAALIATKRWVPSEARARCSSTRISQPTSWKRTSNSSGHERGTEGCFDGGSKRSRGIFGRVEVDLQRERGLPRSTKGEV